jgi:hypothetical protein
MPSSHPTPRRAPPAAWLAVAGILAPLVAGPTVAQSPTTVTPTSPTQIQPPSSSLPTTGALPQPVVAVSPQVIVGRWSHRRQDDETRSADTVTIEFMPDGRYFARNRNSLLPTPEKPSQGRYSIANLQGNAFDLRIERDLADPESDPRDAAEVQRITVVDPNTLQAADGSVVRRVKE